MSLNRAIIDATHPKLIEYAEERARNVQNRIADAITAFAGSMPFIYLHVVWFAIWLILTPFGDVFPFGLLTMIVSLEAIFLSTFVMISQNRADARRQILADTQWSLTQQEWVENDEILSISQQLLQLSQEIQVLTKEVHAAVQPAAT